VMSIYQKTSSGLWCPYTKRHLQDCDVHIPKDIFRTLMSIYQKTSSGLWCPYTKRLLQDCDVHIPKDIFKTVMSIYQNTLSYLKRKSFNYTPQGGSHNRIENNLIIIIIMYYLFLLFTNTTGCFPLIKNNLIYSWVIISESNIVKHL
jgi:hypothetical protein